MKNNISGALAKLSPRAKRRAANLDESIKKRKFNLSAVTAWVLCGVVAIALLANLVIELPKRPLQGNALQLAAAIGMGLLPLVYATVGALIVSNRSRNVIGWLLMGPALLSLGDIPASNLISGVTTPPAEPSLWLVLAVWFATAGWVLLIFPILFIALLFPTGRPLTPRWRPVIYYGIALGALFLTMALLIQEMGPDPAIYGVGWTIKNPIGLLSRAAIEAIIYPWWAIGLGVFTLFALLSLIVRARRAGTVEREQIKWLLYACSLFALVYVPGLGVQGNVAGLADDIFQVLFSLVLLGFPIAIGIAILRYRLYDIDVIIRRTLTYGLVTALLAIVFFGSVILLQGIFSGLTGSGQDEIVTVLSTLAIAALFIPVRNRIQTLIDKRFNRNKYNAQQVLTDFANTVRDETDLEKLAGRLMQVVDETMQPKTVSVWLKRERK